MIVAFTGHRPHRFGTLAAKAWVKDRLRERLLELKPAETISGMAAGFDQWAADVCLELAIPFVAAVPFKGQELRWPQRVQARYHALLAEAVRVHVLAEPPANYAEAVTRLHARNHWMVDNSEAVIAAWDGTGGGTAKCVKYAEQLGRPIYRISGWPV